MCCPVGGREGGVGAPFGYIDTCIKHDDAFTTPFSVELLWRQRKTVDGCSIFFVRLNSSFVILKQ